VCSARTLLVPLLLASASASASVRAGAGASESASGGVCLKEKKLRRVRVSE